MERDSQHRNIEDCKVRERKEKQKILPSRGERVVREGGVCVESEFCRILQVGISISMKCQCETFHSM